MPKSVAVVLEPNPATTLTTQAQTLEPVVLHPTPAPRPRPRKKRLWPRMLKTIRRVHLYLGLALLPWVGLYGVTALLFNHSSWLSSSTVLGLNGAKISKAGWPDAARAGEIALAAAPFVLLDEAGMPRAVEVVQGSERLLGSYSITGRATVAGGVAQEDLRLSVDALLRGGTLRRTAVREEPEPLELEVAEDGLRMLAGLGVPSEAALEELAVALAAAEGLELDSVRIRRWPTARFQILDGEQLLECELGLDGDLEVTRADAGSSLRSKLLRLHLQHGNPGYLGSRSLWAISVDAVGVAMVLWGISGIVMWWTIRPTRRWGTAALALGLTAMAALAVWIWRAAGLA